MNHLKIILVFTIVFCYSKVYSQLGGPTVTVESSIEESNSTFCLKITTKDFTDLYGFLLPITWDSEVLEFVQISGIDTSPLGITSEAFDLSKTEMGYLKVIWDYLNQNCNNVTQSLTLDDGAELFSICFKMIGGHGSSSEVSIDKFGNFCGTCSTPYVYRYIPGAPCTDIIWNITNGYVQNKNQIEFGLAYTAHDTVTATLYPNFNHDTVEYQNLTVVFSLPAGTVTEPAVSYNSIYSGSFPTLVGPGTWNISRQNATILNGGSTLNLDIYTARINGTFSDAAISTDSIGLFYFRLPGDCNDGNIALAAKGDPISMAAPNSNEVTAIRLENWVRIDTFLYSGNRAEADTLTCPLYTPDMPIANEDIVTIDEDNSVIIDVLSNDIFGSDGPSNSDITIVSQPSNGTATILNKSTSTPTDDEIRYTPQTDYNGSDSFIYQICDAGGDCDQATVNITINPVDEPFEAIDDNFTFYTTDNHFTLDVLENDYIGYPLYLFSIFSQPNSGGSISKNDNGTLSNLADDFLELIPQNGYEGTFTFKYLICYNENQIICKEGTVTITLIDLDCTSGNLDIEIPEVDLNSQNVAVKNKITSRSRIQNGSKVNFFAGESIILRPGFRVSAGAEFSARIQECTDVPSNTNSSTFNADIESPVTTSIKDIRIYPNPFTSTITIEVGGASSPTDINVYSIQGQLLRSLKSTEMSRLSVDLSFLESGVYVVKVIGKDFTESRIIVKSY